MIERGQYTILKAIRWIFEFGFPEGECVEREKDLFSELVRSVGRSFVRSFACKNNNKKLSSKRFVSPKILPRFSFHSLFRASFFSLSLPLLLCVCVRKSFIHLFIRIISSRARDLNETKPPILIIGYTTTTTTTTLLKVAKQTRTHTHTSFIHSFFSSSSSKAKRI